MDRILFPVPSKRPATGQDGFTLIELLVVISIIALLVGILLPALGAARRTAQKSQCLSNIRQMDTAAMSFAADHRFHIQISSTDTVWGTTIPSEMRGKVAPFIAKPGNPSSPGRIKDWGSAIVPYMGGANEDDFEAINKKVSKAFICPSDGNQGGDPSSYSTEKLGYSIHNNISGGATIDKLHLPISYGINADATTFNNNGNDPAQSGTWAGGLNLRPYRGDVTNGSLDSVRSTSNTMIYADCGTRKDFGENLLASGNQLFYSATLPFLATGLNDQDRDIGTLSAVEQNSRARQRIPLSDNLDVEGPADRHSDQINVAFADGHAASSGADSFSDVYLSPHK